jgi:D-alanyl-D-alanine carboxypeptidase/D-alanyl-D-alanine-endopeptidase (penicillin-binding protein 4)
MYTRLLANIFSILLLVSCSAHQSDLLYKQKPAFYSYIIGDVKSDHVDKEHAADVYATPASCQKVVTALIALNVLGPDYQYETKLYATKKGGIVRNVVISFSGDPHLTSEDLFNLLSPLKGSKIHGDIVLDVSVFKTPAHAPNIMVDDIGTFYAQPVFGANIDKNQIKVRIAPSSVDKPACIENDSGYQIENNVKTTGDKSSVILLWDNGHIKAKGNINPNEVVLEIKISPYKIEPYVLYKVKNILKTLGIQNDLKIIDDEHKLPTNLTLLNAIKSKKLKETLAPNMKASDNLVFDSMYLKIANSFGPITDWRQGNNIMKELVKKYFNIDIAKATIIDGSGLSRYNSIQPRHLFELLKQGSKMEDFVASLAKPAEAKSTLGKRDNLPSDIVAKTGYMSGISCLCGYKIVSNKSTAFVIMANSFAPPKNEIFDVIDKFIRNNIK